VPQPNHNQPRPTCLNHGCVSPVAHCGARWRPFCQRCHKAGYGSGKLKESVTAFKTGYCQNVDGVLGFNCPMNYEKAPWAIGLTQVDHVDGNYYNNTPDNCMELCEGCHRQKSKLSGDYKQQRKYN